MLGDIFPAGRGRVLLVLMNQLENYRSKLKQVNDNEKKFGQDQVATHETAAYKIGRAWASIQSDLTSFGKNVLPPLLDGVKGVADEVGKVGKAFERLDPQTKKMIITGGLVVAAIGPAMRIASFFLGGVSKLLSAATIASRLAGGQGWAKAFGKGGMGAGGALSEVAEMRVNQMIVAELIAKNIPGVGGTGSRVPRASGVSARTPSGGVAAAPEAAPAVPSGYVYDPMLGRNVRVAGARPAVSVAEATRGVTPTMIANIEKTRGAVPVPLSGLSSSLTAERQSVMRELSKPIDRRTLGLMANAYGAKIGMAERMIASEIGAPGVITPALRQAGGALRQAGGGVVAGAKAAPGIISKGFKGLGTMASRGMGAFAIGATGFMASDMIGNAVKGSVGSAIKDIGKDASIGAGLGSFFGPEGTAGGAIIGGLVGTFAHFMKHPTHGQNLANLVTQGFGGAGKTPDSLTRTIADAQNAMDKLTKRTVQVAGPRGARRDVTTHVAFGALSGADQEKFMREANKLGFAVAGQLEKGWNQYKFQDEPTMFVQLRSQMQHLVPQAQAAAAMSAVKFAEGLEKSGRLPKGSAQKMLRQVEQEFPRFAQYLGLSADASVKQFTKALDFTKAEKNVHTTLNTIAYKDFPQLQTALELTRGSTADKAKAMITSLQGIAKHGTGPAKTQAIKDIAAIKASFSRDLTASARLVEQKSKDMEGSLRKHSSTAESTATTNFDKLATNIGAAMAAGVENTNKGMTLLAQAANATLVAFGGAKVPLPVLKSLTPRDLQIGVSTPQGRSALQNYGGSTASGTGTSYGAKGGVFQIGNPGDRGGDNVPLSIMAGRGEKVAVFNAQQQAVIDRHLAGVGGLEGMFAQNAQPHYATPRRFAGGGIVTASQYGGPGDPTSGIHGYKGDNLYQHPDTYAELQHGHGAGASAVHDAADGRLSRQVGQAVQARHRRRRSGDRWPPPRHRSVVPGGGSARLLGP